MTWDYLIVGAGFAGSVLAERLASQPSTLGEDFGELPPRLRDRRLERTSSPTLDYGLYRHEHNQGPDLPDLGR